MSYYEPLFPFELDYCAEPMAGIVNPNELDETPGPMTDYTRKTNHTEPNISPSDRTYTDWHDSWLEVEKRLKPRCRSAGEKILMIFGAAFLFALLWDGITGATTIPLGF